MDRLVLLQFLLLLIAVPLQYLIVSQWSSKDIEQKQALNQVSDQVNRILNLFSPQTWFNWFISFVIEVPLGFNPLLHKRTWRRGIESPATEVYHIREKYGYFASNLQRALPPHPIQPIISNKKYLMIRLASPSVRSPRPSSVKFRVGQVVKHKLYGYHGVITGWDETARAPDRWLNEHHRNYPELRKQPNYGILLDTRDRQEHKTYVPQEHLEVIQHYKIKNAQLSDFFSAFDGAQYIMQSWLKEQYPHD